MPRDTNPVERRTDSFLFRLANRRNSWLRIILFLAAIAAAAYALGRFA